MDSILQATRSRVWQSMLPDHDVQAYQDKDILADLDIEQSSLQALLTLHSVLQMHREVYASLSALRTGRAELLELPTSQLADMCYLYRKAADWTEDLRKELSAVEELLANMASAKWLEEHTNASEDEEGNKEVQPIRGRISSGTPDTKLAPMLPKADTPEFANMMKALGVHEWAIEAGLCKPHWPALSQLLTEIAKEGKPLPKGFEGCRTRPTLKLVLQPRRGVDVCDLSTMKRREPDF